MKKNNFFKKLFFALITFSKNKKNFQNFKNLLFFDFSWKTHMHTFTCRKAMVNLLQNEPTSIKSEQKLTELRPKKKVPFTKCNLVKTGCCPADHSCKKVPMLTLVWQFFLFYSRVLIFNLNVFCFFLKCFFLNNCKKRLRIWNKLKLWLLQKVKKKQNTESLIFLKTTTPTEVLSKRWLEDWNKQTRLLFYPFLTTTILTRITFLLPC